MALEMVHKAIDIVREAAPEIKYVLFDRITFVRKSEPENLTRMAMKTISSLKGKNISARALEEALQNHGALEKLKYVANHVLLACFNFADGKCSAYIYCPTVSREINYNMMTSKSYRLRYKILDLLHVSSKFVWLWARFCTYAMRHGRY